MKTLATIPKHGTVGVVGTGISSLFFAYFLNAKRPDLRITLLEKNKDRAGGWIYTKHTTANVKLEKGPRTLRGRNIGTSLIIASLARMKPSIMNEIMYVDKKSAANKKFLMDSSNPKTLVQMPPTDFSLFYKFMKSGVSNGLFKSIIHDIFSSSKATGEESVYDFFLRRFGDARVVNNVISALFFGIYATDVQVLSMNYCLPTLAKLEKQHGSIVKGVFAKKRAAQEKEEAIDLENIATKLSIDKSQLTQIYNKLKDLPVIGFEKGMSTMPETVKEYLLQNPNVDIRYGYNVEQVDVNTDGSKIIVNQDLAFDHVNLSAIPQNLKINHPQLKDYLQQLGKGTNVLLINIYHPTKDIIREDLKSFGFLVPKSNNSKLLGVIFDSVIESNFEYLYPTQAGAATIASKPKTKYTKMTMMVSCDGVERSDISFDSYKKSIILPCIVDQLGLSEEEAQILMQDDDLLVEYTFANNSIPKYATNIGFSTDRNSDIRTVIETDLLSNYNISVGGFKFAAGPGMPDVVMQSLDAANKIK